MKLVRDLRVLLTVLSLNLLSSASVWAEESSDKGGLPQFDASLFPEQLFWLAVTFIVLYILMRYVALPKVQGTQDQRQTTLAAQLQVASDANQKAKSTLADYEKALADAHAQAQSTVAQIRTQTTKEAAQRQSDQQQVLSKKLQDAEASIRTARDQAVKNIQNDAQDLAKVIIEKITSMKSGSLQSRHTS